MDRLEDLKRDAIVKGILRDQQVTVVDAKWIGSAAIELTYKDEGGNLGNELIYRDSESSLEIVTAGRLWSFDGDGALFRLVSEAYRIRLGSPVRSATSGPYIKCGRIATPDHSSLRRYAPTSTLALSACRRPRCGKDNYDGAISQRAPRAG